MVKVREITRDTASAEWLEVLTARLPQNERELVVRADIWAQEHYAGSLHPAGTRWIEYVRAAAGILGALRVDPRRQLYDAPEEVHHQAHQEQRQPDEKHRRDLAKECAHDGLIGSASRKP